MRLVGVGNYYGVTTALSDMFKECIQISSKNYKPTILQKGDVVLFGGGEDISPSLYNQKPSFHTAAGEHLSPRDFFELNVFNEAFARNIPMIGVCRGAQLLCAASGGSLYQHVNGHANNGHMITTKEGREMYVCSVHHQMMNPAGTKHELIAWASEVISNVHLIENEKNIIVDVEPEIVYFEDTKALGIQWHPEFMLAKDEAVVYIKEVIKGYLKEKTNAL